MRSVPSLLWDRLMSYLLELIQHAFHYLIEYAFYPGGSDTFSFMRLFSLLLAFSISGAMAVFMNQSVIIQFLGPQAPRRRSYLVAALSGTILAVCSCSVLPMFVGIRKKGAGLGPAMAFLVSGPAINILALTLTVTDLGLRFAAFRLIGAVTIALAIGAIMAWVYSRNEVMPSSSSKMFDKEEGQLRLSQQGIIFSLLIAMLVFGVYRPLFTAPFGFVLVIYLIFNIKRQQAQQWGNEVLWLAKKILPLFVAGVFVAGVLDFVLRVEWVQPYLSGDHIAHYFIAAMMSALMYFATLTEIPIVQSLMNLGMGNGPAVTLLLAGPTVSIPNLLVIAKALGVKKTITYLLLLIGMTALFGMTASLFF
jgi:uncharacterized protein